VLYPVVVLLLPLMKDERAALSRILAGFFRKASPTAA
jgi:hypothetical protein